MCRETKFNRQISGRVQQNLSGIPKVMFRLGYINQYVP